jgi:hypothetical protein
MGRKGALPHESVHFFVVDRERRAAVETPAAEIARKELVAIRRHADLAAGAVAAGIAAENDPIIRLDLGNAFTNRFDNPGAFVAENNRLRHRYYGVIAHRHVGVTNAGRDQSNPHFVMPRLFQF